MASGQRVGKTITDMQKRIAEAAQGMGEGRQALDLLGLEAEELINLSPEVQFEVLSERIAGLENPAQRSAAAMRLFGESGAELMPLFRSGGALDDARVSLGAMPEVLQRNAVGFERIDTLLGRIPNKTRQVFAGIGDMLGDELLGPLEALNRIDFTPLGQRIGAFVDLAIDAFRDGTLADFIGLTIEAGFEQGTAAARRAIDSSLAWLGSGGEGWKVVLNGVMTFGTETATTLVDAFTTPLAWLSAGFRKVGEEARVIFQTAGSLLSRSFAAVLNAITAGFENLLNGVIQRVNQITAALPFTDGTQISSVSFGRVDWQTSVIEPARDFNELLAKQREGLESISDFVTGNLNRNLEASRAIIGLEAEATDDAATATERLNQLIEQRIVVSPAQECSCASRANSIAHGVRSSELFRKEPCAQVPPLPSQRALAKLSRATSRKAQKVYSSSPNKKKTESSSSCSGIYKMTSSPVPCSSEIRAGGGTTDAKIGSSATDSRSKVCPTL